MRRWRERYEEFGYDGLCDRHKGRPSPKRVPLKTAEEVLQLYREKYFDFNVRHFHEKLTEELGIDRRRRPRRPMPGMMLAGFDPQSAGRADLCMRCAASSVSLGVRNLPANRVGTGQTTINKD
jgi:hypothetical protein